jgi:hypothetical protein
MTVDPGDTGAQVPTEHGEIIGIDNEDPGVFSVSKFLRAAG